MANRSGIFLSPDDREALLLEVARHEGNPDIDTYSAESGSDDDGGCRICFHDDDHGNMLLCELCSAEYHFYCVGLRSVPTGDWLCGKASTWDRKPWYGSVWEKLVCVRMGVWVLHAASVVSGSHCFMSHQHIHVYAHPHAATQHTQRNAIQHSAH